MVLNQHSVLQHCERTRLYTAVWLLSGRVKDYVIGLPLPWFAASVYEWRVVAIESATLAVGVGFVVVRVEHLNFVAAHEIDATIAPALPVALYDRRRGPFDM